MLISLCYFLCKTEVQRPRFCAALPEIPCVTLGRSFSSVWLSFPVVKLEFEYVTSPLPSSSAVLSLYVLFLHFKIRFL